MSQGLSTWLLEAPDGFGDPDFHAHHAIQLTICFEGRLALTGGDQAIAAPVIAVAPDVRHRLSGSGLIGIIFIEPESRAGEALAKRFFTEQPMFALDDRDFVRLIDPLRHALDAPLTRQQMLDLSWAAIRAVAPVGPTETTDDRIVAIIAHAAAHLGRPITLQSAAEAARVFLSESRLRHLFVEQTGLPFRTYLLWLRLVRAVQLYSEGQSLTAAAHSAGFADSAHFSRMFKRTFGSPATTLTRL